MSRKALPVIHLQLHLCNHKQLIPPSFTLAEPGEASARSTETLHTPPPVCFCLFCVGWRFFTEQSLNETRLWWLFSLAEGLQREKPVLRLAG